MQNKHSVENQNLWRVLLHENGTTIGDDMLLEMVISLQPQKTVSERLAQRLLLRFGSCSGVLAAPISELQASGLSITSATSLKLIQAAAIRMIKAELVDRPILDNWDRLMEYLTALLARERIEQLRGLFLDTQQRLIVDEQLARGTVNHTPVYPREIIRRALEVNAAGLILVHNHPSGDATPSETDIATARQVDHACRSVALTLCDCVVIGNGTWTSLRREGLT